MDMKHQRPITIEQIDTTLSTRIIALGWSVQPLSVPPGVHLSRINYSTFVEKFLSIKESVKNSERGTDNHNLKRLLDYISPIFIKIPSDFILDWYEHVHRRLGAWEEWDGDISKETFSPSSQAFKKRVYKEAHKGGYQNFVQLFMDRI